MSCRFSPEAFPREMTPVDNLFITHYLPRATGVQAAVYLYGLMQCRYPGSGTESLCAALGITPQQERDAFLFWQAQGLVEIVSTEPLEVLYKPVSPIQEEGAAAVMGRFSAFHRAMQNLFAPRQLTPGMLKQMQDWVDTFGLEEEAALLLAQYCIQKKGKRIGIKYMDAVADSWARAGVNTVEEAREQIRLFEEQTAGAASVLKRLRILRLPTADEQALYDKWINQWQMEPGAVLEACALMTGAQQPNLKYLDTIVEGLCRKGARTADAVRQEVAGRDSSAKLARLVFERAGIERAPDASQRRTLDACLQEGMPVEVLLFAADSVRSSNGGARLLMDTAAQWRAEKVHTLAQAQQAWEQRPGKPKQKKNAALEYVQRQYSDEELLRMAVDLDGED